MTALERETLQDTTTMPTELARFLQGEYERIGSWRGLETHTGVPDSTLQKIAKEEIKGPPELGTLMKLSEVYSYPLWRMVEMAGLETGINQTPSVQAQRLDTLSRRHPELMDAIMERLRNADPSDLRGVLAYLDAILGQRSS
jgi:hypothetical protein